MSDDIMKPLEAMKLHTIQGIKRTSAMTQDVYDHEMKLLAQRQAVGRYTLEEAAMAVSKATGARADEILHKVMEAAGAGALPTYERGKDSRYIYGEGFASRVRDFYEEAYWDDLNAWIEANEKRITWRFSAPASQKVGAGHTAKAPAGKTKGKQGGDRLTRAMIAAYDRLTERHHTQPTCRALFDWLKDNDETGAVEDSQDDVLTFRRGDGGLKDVTFDAFTDRFSRLPQRKTPH